MEYPYSHAMARLSISDADDITAREARRVSFADNTERSEESLSSFVEEAIQSPALRKRLVALRQENRGRNELDLSSHERSAIGNLLDVEHHHRQDVDGRRSARSGVSTNVAASSTHSVGSSSSIPQRNANNAKPSFVPML